MTYINWNATTNIYRTSKRDDNPMLCLYCWGDFYRPSNTGSGAHINNGSYNYITADWVMASSSSRLTTVNVYNTIYIGGYGADYTTSGKYDIKKAYDLFTGFSNTVDCEITCAARMYTHTYDDDWGWVPTKGKCWVKSFNCWFSKS